MASLNPSPGLSLEFKPLFIPKTISQFLAGVSRISSVTEKVLQFDDFVDRLETETRKIEAFKRELPLCMLLINDAIAALKAESMMLKKSSKAEPVLEEFIPLKNSCDDDYPKVEINTNQKDNGDKKNWLSSTHLWNTNENLSPKLNSVAQKIEKRAEEKGAERVVVNGNYRLIPCSMPNVESNIRIGGTTPVPPTSRKRRRSWSTELHRRFVNALQQLGGSQAATPKQIRELMQVDGLTNDEVKSHLQKYRLHTRRIPSSKTNRSSPVVEGELWMSRSSESHSGSPDGPLLNGEISIDDEHEEKSENYSCNGNL